MSRVLIKVYVSENFTSLKYLENRIHLNINDSLIILRYSNIADLFYIRIRLYTGIVYSTLI